MNVNRLLPRNGAAAFALAFLLLFPSMLYAQDDVDDLFAVPDETVESQNDSESESESGDTDTEDDAENSESDVADDGADENGEDAIDLDALTTRDKPTVKGTVSLSGSIAGGFLDWPVPEEGAPYGDILWEEFDASVYYDMSSSVSVDARPLPYFRYFAKLSTSMDESRFSFPTPSVSELFIDYTLAERYFFRVGKQSMSWGQAQLLSNPGDLVSDVKDGIAVKMFMPLGVNGLTSVIYVKDGWLASTASPSPLDFAYASLFETSAGPFTLGFSGKFNRNLEQSLIGNMYVKTNVLGVDIALEGRGDFDVYPAKGDAGTAWGIGPSYLWPTTQALVHMFWESSDIGLQLIGEYRFSYGPEITTRIGPVPAEESAADTNLVWAENGVHRSGLGIVFTDARIFGLKPAVRWYHQYNDHSGQIVFGLTGSIAPLLNINIGLPVTYGQSWSYYRQNNEDPAGRVVSLVVQLSLSRSF
ncbi:hypothetical protein [Salinispira pacifica]|uniref:Uncharacterized protein n=1 Tax=Salinispira pacifica TaxID=1307761 RepID=V5WKW9_9SPIO|nr:hypothetical protein [Salinispira pacifica]AHC16472.1 hypothetical protein L21SP2_3130 [Salinispira pacifica]